MSLIGYARVSTQAQQASLDGQVSQLKELGCEKVFTDIVSGAKAQRPGLDAALDYLRANDTLVVTKLDRLGRTTLDTLTTMTELSGRGIAVKALDLDLDTSTAAGQLVVSVMASLAQFERDRLIERTNEGVERARKAGKRMGRPPALSPDAIDAVVAALDSGMSVAAVARLHGVARGTINKAYTEAKTAR